MNPSVIFTNLFQSFGINCTIFVVTLLVALPVGLLVAFGAMNRWEPFRCLRGSRLASGKWGAMLVGLRPIALLIKFFVWIVRGTPLMLQIIFIYYGPGLLHWGQPWNAMGTDGRVVATCAAFAINYACYFSEIPPMGNEFMTLIKDTALANIIATKEIIMMSKEFINRGLIWPLFSTALFFLVFCGVLTLLFGWLERKMDYFRV